MRLILIPAFLICSVCAFAQTKTYVGFKSGGHVGSAVFDHTFFALNIKTAITSGFHTGVFVKYFPSERDKLVNSGIQFGINYVQKGWDQMFDTDEPTHSTTLTYLELPLEGIGYFGNKNKYFITGGFLVEFLLNDKTSAVPTNPGNANFVTYIAMRDRETGYGVRISGGAFRDFSFGTIHLEGFFTYSFSNFIDAGNLVDRTPNVSNFWTAGISVGYLIPFGKMDPYK